MNKHRSFVGPSCVGVGVGVGFGFGCGFGSMLERALWVGRLPNTFVFNEAYFFAARREPQLLRTIC